MTSKATTKEKNNAVIISPPRLPYHSEFEKKFNITLAKWRVLIDSIFPGAQTIESILTAISYCQARNLDVLKRVVHIVPVWDSNRKKYVETVWPGIAELRTTAFRTKKYGGMSEIELGSIVEENIGQIKLKFPEWGRKTVIRFVEGTPCKFVGPKVYWKEVYAAKSKNDITPNARWQRAPFSQHEKCVDAAALRAAFPEEVNDYAAEEMEGQVWYNTSLSETIPKEKSESTEEKIKAAKENRKAVEQENENLPERGENAYDNKKEIINYAQEQINEEDILGYLKQKIIDKIKKLSSENKSEEINKIKKEINAPKMVPEITDVDLATIYLDKLNEIE